MRAQGHAETEGFPDGHWAAVIDDLIGEEAFAEIRYLHQRRLGIESEEAGVVDGVLVRACDEALIRFDVIGEYARVLNRCGRQHAANAAGFRHLRKPGTPIALVDYRPAPDRGEPAIVMYPLVITVPGGVLSTSAADLGEGTC